jgi:uncharacterized membrane protein
MGSSIWPVLLVAFFLGGLTGLRAFVPLTVLVWMLHVEHVRILGSPLYFLHKTEPLVILSILAIAELIFDKLPFTPSRLKIPGIVGRVILGIIVGIVSGQAWGASWQTCAIAGFIGAILGSWAGHEIRTRWTRELHWHDLPVALLEDAVTIGGTVLIVSRAILFLY